MKCGRNEWVSLLNGSDLYFSKREAACLSQDKRLRDEMRDELTEQVSLFPCHVGGTGIREPKTFGLWRNISSGT